MWQEYITIIKYYKQYTMLILKENPKNHCLETYTVT